MKTIITLITIVLTITVLAADWKQSSTELIKQFETFRPSPYRDVNKLAIGWGFNDPNLVKRGHMTEKEANDILNVPYIPYPYRIHLIAQLSLLKNS